MHPTEIKNFKENVADPKMAELFANTKIERITNFIDSITVTFSDGRSYGFDCLLKANGYTYFPQDGDVVTYEYQAVDIPVKDFVSRLIADKDVIIGDGLCIVEDDQQPITIQTEIRNASNCSPIFKEMSAFKKLKHVNDSIEYEKVLHLFNSKQK